MLPSYVTSGAGHLDNTEVLLQCAVTFKMHDNLIYLAQMRIRAINRVKVPYTPAVCQPIMWQVCKWRRSRFDSLQTLVKTLLKFADVSGAHAYWKQDDQISLKFQMWKQYGSLVAIVLHIAWVHWGLLMKWLFVQTEGLTEFRVCSPVLHTKYHSISTTVFISTRQCRR